METAVQLKSLGLVPVIVEKSSSLGGHVAQWNRLFPDMTPANKVLEPYDEALKEVDIYTDTEITARTSGVRRLYSLPDSSCSRRKKRRNTDTAFTTGSSPTAIWRTGSIRVPMSAFPSNLRRSALCTAWVRAM